jgi:hypothetical protein
VASQLLGIIRNVVTRGCLRDVVIFEEKVVLVPANRWRAIPRTLASVYRWGAAGFLLRRIAAAVESPQAKSWANVSSDALAAYHPAGTLIRAMDVKTATLKSSWLGYDLIMVMVDGTEHALKWNRGMNNERAVMEILAAAFGDKYRLAA